jgi:hypothetical protein
VWQGLALLPVSDSDDCGDSKMIYDHRNLRVAEVLERGGRTVMANVVASSRSRQAVQVNIDAFSWFNTAAACPLLLALMRARFSGISRRVTAAHCQIAEDVVRRSLPTHARPTQNRKTRIGRDREMSAGARASARLGRLLPRALTRAISAWSLLRHPCRYCTRGLCRFRLRLLISAYDPHWRSVRV